MRLLLPTLLLCVTAHAAEVVQFRAEDFGAEWYATRGGATLSAVHATTNGWAAAFADGGGVSFAATNGVASPLAFDSATTSAVSRVLLVADCTEARPWSALLDAPSGVMLAPRAFAWEAVRFAESNGLGAVAMSVDGVAGAAMPTDGTPHLVEVAFPEPVAASELYLGGHPATPVWNRSWRGCVYEALFCFGEPSTTDADALRSYLSLRWRLGLDFDAPPDILMALVIVFLIAVTAIGGNKGGTNDPPLRAGGGMLRTIPAEDLPAWFVTLGYPATDADASGIPDCWERWTHTRGFAAGADPDGDGLTNLAEFEAQTDPIRADTDGDGIDDATELAGLAAGVPDLDPLAPATFAANEPDTDGDGIPDLWESGTEWVYLGVDPDGFPSGPDIPEADAGNYDVRIAVSSTRHARLTWGNGDDEAMLLPPCTNLALRLRLSADEDRRVALTPHPSDGTATGLWKAELVVEWDDRREQETEENRVRTSGGDIIDAEPDRARFAGILSGTLPETTRGARNVRSGGNRDEAGFWFWRKSLALSGSGYCALHGPALVVTAGCENVDPPLEWSVTGGGTVSGGTEFSPATHGWEGLSTEVVCTKRDGKSRILLQARETFEAVACGRPQTNIVGACSISSHDPLDPSDHEPRVEEHVVRYFPNCPPTTNVTVVAGFTHDTAILWIRNLVRILTGDPMDDETDHCFGMVWTNSFQVNLESFIDPIVLPFRTKVLIRAIPDGIERKSLSPPNDILVVEDEPNNLRPIRYHIELVDKQTQVVLDRMWLVINSGEAAQLYSDWLVANTSLSWTTVLPAAFEDIALITNGTSVLPDPSVHYPGWKDPKRNESLLHHDAVYEMRSEHVGDHGHQATYDSSGRLIRSTIAAGTADYFHPFTIRFPAWTVAREDHYRNDVIPFLRALNLDGNPGIYNSRYAPTNLDRPCIRQGTNTDQYIYRRPILPGGTTPRTP